MHTRLRCLDGKTIHWQDSAGVIHSCEAAEVHPGLWLIWTDCQRDVPGNEAYRAPHIEAATCSSCAAAYAASVAVQ